MLSAFLLSQLFAFLLVFCRIGSAMMLLPGFGETFVPARIRLLLALFLSVLLAAALSGLPPAPSGVSRLFLLMLGEIMTGLFIGGLSRMLISAMHTAGSVIAYQTGLSASLALGIGQFQGQDTALGNLLTFTAVLLLFVTDLHHLMLRGLADSYTLFVPGQFPMVEDFAHHATRLMSGAFHMAVQLAAPSLVVGTILNLGSGIISRLMPNLQVFFLMISPQLLIGFFILMVTFSAIMLWYMEYFRDALSGFLAP